MNNKPKFTPGPWKFETTEIVSASNGTIATIRKHNFLAEAQANAALIAAAPEMFAALQSALELTDIKDFNQPNSNLKHEAIILNILAVLKKARGE